MTGGTNTGGGTTGGSAGAASGRGGDAGAGGEPTDGGAAGESGQGGTGGSMAGMSGSAMGGAGTGGSMAGSSGSAMGGAGTGGSMAGSSGSAMGGAGTGGSMAGSGGSAMGGAGTGGSGTAGGGAGGSAGALNCATPNIFDDMEDGDGGICSSSTRQGGWYVAKESGVGSILPDVGTVVGPVLLTPARGSSTRAMHFQGAGFTGNGHYAFIAASVNGGGTGIPYDASVHNGIRFWGRSASGSVSINVRFGTIATTSSVDGGSCTPTATLACYDHWQAPRTLTGAWQQFSIYFPSDLSQLGWGVPRPKDLAHLIGIEFYYNSTGNPASFDYFIDDIEFW
jgi:hypothetical protein